MDLKIVVSTIHKNLQDNQIVIKLHLATAITRFPLMGSLSCDLRWWQFGLMVLAIILTRG